MNILITGGAGYLGSVLTPLLLNNGHKVTIIDNFLYRQSSLLDVAYNENLEIVNTDVRLIDSWSGHIAKADFIIPLACLVGAPLCDRKPNEAKQVNLLQIKNILTLKSNQQGLIFPCTNSGYGIGQNDIFCDESSPLKPISLYGKLKVEAEQLIVQSKQGLSLRFATLFGISPRMRLDLLVNDFTYRAVNDRQLILFEPHFKRNYLHVRDAARAIMFSIDHYEKMKGQSYNVGISDANLSKEQLCQVIKKVTPDFEYFISEKGTDPDKRNYIVSNEKIERLGFAPKHSLKGGIQELVKGYKIITDYEHRNY